MLIDKVASTFVFLIPYIIAVTGYYLLLKKILRMDNRIWRVIAMIVFAAGCFYSITTFFRTVHSIFDPMNFDLVVIAINFFFMLLVAIAIAMGKPDEPKRSDAP